jgi:uroporphyrinogen-III synthase
MELAGRTILITRAASQSADLRARLEAAGARVLESPILEIVPVDDWSVVDAAVSRLDSYDWLILTSTNAVEYFLNRARAAGVVCRISIAVVGSATAAKLNQWGLTPSIVPRQFRAEGLLEVFPSDLTGKRILLPRAETAREILPEELRRRGAVVDVVPVYRTIKDPKGSLDLTAILKQESVDAIVLTSPSAVRFLTETFGDELQSRLSSIAIAVIGPVAAAAVTDAGLQAAIQPEKATIAELVDAIRAYFSNRTENT